MKIFVDDSILIKGRKCEAYSSDAARDFISPYSAAVAERVIAAGMEITENRDESDAALLPYCKHTGYFIKPTYGTVSRFGLIADASSMDQVHIGAEKIENAFAVLSAIAGYDPRDGTSYPAAKYEYAPFAGEIKVAEFGELDFKYADYLEAVYTIIWTAEYSNNVSRIDGIKFGHRTKNYKNINELIVNSRSEAFSFEAMMWALTGTYVLSEGQFEKYYLKAAKLRRLIKQELDEIFKQADVIRVPDMTPAYLTGCPAIYKPDGCCFITRNGQEGNFYEV